MTPRNFPLPVQTTIRRGGVGVLPTDTIYGLVGSALDRSVIRRIYSLRRRNPRKPMIILIGAYRDIRRFGIRLDVRTRRALGKVWPGKVSVILACRSKKFSYLHRGTQTLAFRMPGPAWLRAGLRKTGPLAAPSANTEGKPPARSVREAKRYFANRIDFYMDAGRLVSRPSTIVRIERGKASLVREGAVPAAITRAAVDKA